jgi:hypothetical protein
VHRRPSVGLGFVSPDDLAASGIDTDEAPILQMSQDGKTVTFVTGRILIATRVLNAVKSASHQPVRFQTGGRPPRVRRCRVIACGQAYIVGEAAVEPAAPEAASVKPRHPFGLVAGASATVL